jgi:ATP-dependent helicase/nuclease subunit B
VIEHAEWKIHEELPAWKIGGVSIRGVIDRVERRGGEVRVLDYKTADEGKSPKTEHYSAVNARTNAMSVPGAAVFDLKGKTQRWKDLQLPLYCLAARQLYPDAETISCGYFNLPKAVEQTGIMPLPVTEELLEEAERCAGEVVGAITAGRFWPPAERVRYGAFEELLFDVPEETIDAAGLGAVEWMERIGK